MGHLEPPTLAFASELQGARDRVRLALERLSADEAQAARALKLGKKNRAELGHNLVLGESGALPAVERYTGVLYDMLDVPTLDRVARSWVDRHVYVQSALFGLLRASDEIPAYRLSAGSRLPHLGAPLKRVWLQAHAAIDWGRGSRDLTLDLRSQDYAALAELPGAVRLHVAQRAADGRVRALNHFNKAAKGDLVRRLARSGGSEITDVAGLLDWADGEGIELVHDGELTLVTELGAPG